MNKCSYCGKEASEYILKRNRGVYRPIKLYPDSTLECVCSDCKGQYKTLRLAQYIKRGLTLPQARRAYDTSVYRMWSP